MRLGGGDLWTCIEDCMPSWRLGEQLLAAWKEEESSLGHRRKQTAFSPSLVHGRYETFCSRSQPGPEGPGQEVRGPAGIITQGYLKMRSLDLPAK